MGQNCKEFGHPSSTVYDVCKNVDRMVVEYNQGGSGGLMCSKPQSFDSGLTSTRIFLLSWRQQVANKWSTSS